MADAEAAPVAPKKTPKKKASKPKKPSSHPKYSEMIKAAIAALKVGPRKKHFVILKLYFQFVNKVYWWEMLWMILIVLTA